METTRIVRIFRVSDDAIKHILIEAHHKLVDVVITIHLCIEGDNRVVGVTEIRKKDTGILLNEVGCIVGCEGIEGVNLLTEGVDNIWLECNLITIYIKELGKLVGSGNLRGELTLEDEHFCPVLGNKVAFVALEVGWEFLTVENSTIPFHERNIISLRFITAHENGYGRILGIRGSNGDITMLVMFINVILKLFRFKSPKAVGIVEIHDGHLELGIENKLLLLILKENGFTWIESSIFNFIGTFRCTFKVLEVEGEDRACLEGLKGHAVEPHTITLHLLARTTVNLLKLVFGLNVHRGIERALFAVTNDETKGLGFLTRHLGLIEHETVDTRGFYVCKIIW